MIKDVPLIGVFVDDQEAALDFYTKKLGLTKIQDEAYGPDSRWITVSPAETEIRIVLKKAQQDHEATARLILFPPLLITATDPTDERFGTLLAMSLAVAFVLNASVAEVWVRAYPQERRPKASGVKAA